LAGQQPSPQDLAAQQPQTMTINTNFVRGQFHTGARKLQQQLLNINFGQQQQQQQLTARPAQASPGSVVQFPDSPRHTFTSTHTGFGSNPADVQIIDEADLPDFRFKRQTKEKRALVTLTDGSVVDDKFFDSDWYDGLAQFGDQGLKQSFTKRDNLEDEIKEHDREPAESEVEAVRAYCNLCMIEPFQSALVMSWKSASSSHGVLKAKSAMVCGDF
jgi:hypothetical protein